MIVKTIMNTISAAVEQVDTINLLSERLIGIKMLKRTHQIILLVIFLALLSSCSLQENSGVNTVHSQVYPFDKSSKLQLNETPDNYLKHNIQNKYASISSKLTLTYNVDVKNSKVDFDCSDFENTLLGYIVGDLNNDDNNDILIFTLEKYNSNSESDDENQIFLHERVYLFNEGTFYEASDWWSKLFNPYLSIGDHTTIKNIYSLLPGNNGIVLVSSNTVYDDSSVYSTKYPPYYSPEDSLGTFQSIFRIQNYVNDEFELELSYQELISHTSGMPEAEHISYTNNLTGESLFSKGVYSVLTGSDMIEPEFKYEDKGRYSNESDAVNVINQDMTKLGFEKYCIENFSWEKKDSNSLILKESGDNTITITLEGETLSNDSYRCCQITVE